MKPRKTRIAIALAAVLAAPTLPTARAQEAAPSQSKTTTDTADTADTTPATTLGEVVVTATRRAVDLKKAPINISAVTSQQIEDLRLEDITDAMQFVPGVSMIDYGARSTAGIVIRGLNANDASDAGSDVATYLGETPLSYDFKLLDVNRIEVLKGPQGTLYGQGTLAGAVKYVPNVPEFNKYSSEFSSSGYGLAQSDGVGGTAKATINLPLVDDRLALRIAAGYFSDPGFIDYAQVVNEPGISIPESEEGTHRYKDANDEETFSARMSLRAKFTDNFEATLNYLRQKTKTHGSNESHSAWGTVGKYESASNYVEPLTKSADLFNIEAKANFGWADLISSSSYTRTKSHSVSDQTPLLLDFEYGYEDFPSFVGTSTNTSSNHQYTQELRLVSTNDSKWNWLVGGYWSKYNKKSHSEENTPGLAQWMTDQGWDVVNREDDLEYWSDSTTKFEELALFGELGYQITDAWQVTVGARRYEYEQSVHRGTDLPLLNTDQENPYELSPTWRDGSTEASGTVYKFNTSYQFTGDTMAYFTYSEGYRIGGINSVAACEQPLEEGKQHTCALPDEQYYDPDTTRNKELGVRTSMFDRRLNLSAAVFLIDWTDLQVHKTTQYGSLSITGNAGTARSKGVELAFDAYLGYGLTLNGSYSYTDAYLTEDVDDIASDRNGYEDGKAGDRLAGSPKHTAALGLNYSTFTNHGWLISANYAIRAQSNMYSKVGNRANGETLPGYATHRASFGFGKNNWKINFYVNNLFNKYAVTSVTNDETYMVQVGEYNRNTYYYSYTVLRPREVGVEFNVKFD